MIKWLARRLAAETVRAASEIEARGTVENPSVPISAAMGPWWGGPNTPAGENVNESNALTISAVFSCVQLIAGILSTLPLRVYRVDGTERVAEPEHPLNDLFNVAPNAEMSSSVWVETVTAHILTWGNGYSEVIRGQDGRSVQGFLPLLPDRTRPRRDSEGQVVYDTYDDDGQLRVIRGANVLHMPGLGYNGLKGYSVVRTAAKSLGLTMAAERFGSGFFANDARPGVVIEHPAKLGPDAADNLRTSIEERHRGGRNAWRPMVLEEGAAIKEVGVPPEEAQFLETRRFQVADVCRWFNVPPFMVGETEKSTSWGTGIEQLNLAFLAYTLSRWLTRWENELKRKVMPEPGFVPGFDLDALLRGDLNSRSQAYQRMVGRPIMTADEARAIEGLPAKGGDADELAQPLNQTVGDQPASQESNT